MQKFILLCQGSEACPPNLKIEFESGSNDLAVRICKAWARIIYNKNVFRFQVWNMDPAYNSPVVSFEVRENQEVIVI